jgi:hypothetical protein
VSTTEQPPQPPAGEPPHEPQPAPELATRQCPRCGAAMTEEQEWCLACGAAVGTRVVAARGWRGPIILAGLIAAVAAVAIAVAIIQLADDTDEVAQNPTPGATATPVPTPVPTLTPDPLTPTPEPSITPEPTTTPSPTPDSGGEVGEWPLGESGWTVVLASTKSEDSALDRAEGFADDGIADVGILDSDDFGSLNPGFWVVYAGQYDSQGEASDALDGIDASDAYIRRIAPN